MSVDFGGVFGGGSRAEATRGWRVGHQGRDRMYYEELHDGVWERVDVDGEMLMGPAHHVIYFASPDAWLRYPPWARQRRDEIIARITSEFREPDYEYHGLMAGARSATTGAPASSNVPASGAKRRAPPRQSEIRALLVAVVLLFALAGAMGWLTARGLARGETYLASKRSFLRRTVSREQEPGLFWLSIGVYAAIGAGALTLGALGVRAGRRLRG
jgi:hypothetical protein